MVNAIHIDFNVPSKMRDGKILYANIFRPDEPGHYPVVLTRTPYGKDYMTGFPYLDIVRFAKCGYIVIVQDVRGRGSSEGEWKPYVNEARDGYDSVEWTAKIEGSNGKVGMWGFSYLGYAQWAAALLKPPHLKAIMPAFTPSDACNGLFWRGGALELGLIVHFFVNSLGLETLSKQFSERPEELGRAINQFIQEVDRIPDGGLSSIPLKDLSPIKNTGLGLDFFKELINHPLDEKFKQLPYSLIHDLSEVQIPALNIAGWNDIFCQDTINNFTYQLKSSQNGQIVRSKLLIGPWSHLNYSNVIGDVDYGMKASMNFIDQEFDHVGLMKKWFDFWLKDEKNGIDEEPAVKIFIGGENKWVMDDQWPISGVINTPFYLHENGLLSNQPPQTEEKFDSFLYDPQDPVLTRGGPILMHPYYIPGARDQHFVENRKDILSFTTDPLQNGIKVIGQVKAYIWASSSTPDTDFVATLLDVHPDGKVYNIADGIIRARYRNGSTPEFLQADTPYEFHIDLWSIGHAFLPGHRIRLDITSSNFPRWDRNLNTKERIGEGIEMRVANQKIFHDSQRLSRTTLPIMPE